VRAPTNHLAKGGSHSKNVRPLLEPDELAGGELGPELLGLLLGAGVESAVGGHALNVGAPDEFRGRRVELAGLGLEGVVGRHRMAV